MGSMLDRLVRAVRQAAKFNQDIQTAPACILWPDRERQWEAAVSRLQGEMPELLVLGGYQPERRMGPAIWLRCVIAGKEASVQIDRTPIIYLPGIGRQDIRAVESCPDHIKPLAELQYRGVIWSQVNAKDWTLLSFLKSDQGGLGLDVSQDNETKSAMLLSLYRLLDVEVGLLEGKRLDRDYFNMLLTGGDPVRDLLLWLDQEEAFRASREPNEWKAFVAVCKSQLAFNPEKEGVLVAAAKIATHEGLWQAVWQRFCEAPRRYPHIPNQIRKCKAPRDDIFWQTGDTAFEGWPQWNDEQEKNLGDALLQLANLPPHAAREKLLQLAQRHGQRQGLVWAEISEAPLAQAMEPLAHLAECTQNKLSAGTIEDLTGEYSGKGWQADDAVLQALSLAQSPKDFEAVSTAVRSMYLPWLEASSRYLQKIVQEEGYPGGMASQGKQAAFPEKECLLFVDGLRFDAGKQLAALVAGRGCEVEEKLCWAALPSVTATGKPAASPVRHQIRGQETTVDFEPSVADTGQSLKSGYHLTKLITEAGWQILDRDSSGDGKGNAWCEFGDIDREGHDRGWKLAKHIDALLKEVRDRILELLSAGWQSVHVVTDHGWLLLPGGLPKIDLPNLLTDNKWGRCAVIKPGASTDEKLYPWFWNPDLHFALADGVCCFRKGLEYAHGGLSFQECLTLELTVTRGTAADSTGPVEITDVAWRGLRCIVAVDGQFAGLQVDIRRQPGDSSSSVVLGIKPLKESGTTSVVVEDEELEGVEATIVLIGAQGELVAQKATVIGGGNS